MNTTFNTSGVPEFDLQKTIEAMRRAASSLPPVFDLVVTTDAIFRQIREYVLERHPCPVPMFGLEALAIDGMEIRAYPTEADAKHAALALAFEGKRSILVTQELPPKGGEDT